jgi:hypothetical protein
MVGSCLFFLARALWGVLCAGWLWVPKLSSKGSLRLWRRRVWRAGAVALVLARGAGLGWAGIQWGATGPVKVLMCRVKSSGYLLASPSKKVGGAQSGTNRDSQ